jgi:hypothetical protein
MNHIRFIRFKNFPDRLLEPPRRQRYLFPHRCRIQVLLTIAGALGAIGDFEASLQGRIKVDKTFA